jgi:hypothetical protein
VWCATQHRQVRDLVVCALGHTQSVRVSDGDVLLPPSQLRPAAQGQQHQRRPQTLLPSLALTHTSGTAAAAYSIGISLCSLTASVPPIRGLAGHVAIVVCVESTCGSTSAIPQPRWPASRHLFALFRRAPPSTDVLLLLLRRVAPRYMPA